MERFKTKTELVDPELFALLSSKATNNITTYSLDELQHEVRDKLGGGDNERSRLIECLGVVFNVTSLPHQRGQSSGKEKQMF